MHLLILGIFILIIASVINSYSGIASQAMRILRPPLFNSPAFCLLAILIWFTLFALGIFLCWIYDSTIAILAGLIYWFFLVPVVATPVMKKIMLPKWDEAKNILEKHGITKDEWVNGNAWKEPRIPSI